MADFVDFSLELPGLRGSRCHVLPAADEAALRHVLDRHAFEVRVLEGGRIHDEPGFFDAVSVALALPPHFGRNWAALDDCLGELSDDTPRLALVWRDVDRSLAADAQTVFNAVLAFDAVCNVWSSQLEVFLLGSSSGFAEERRG
jgi:RNAse (barnase) inhibitor barstar